MASRRRTSSAAPSLEMARGRRERFYLMALLASIPDQIYFKDRDCRFELVSEACARRLGLPRPEDAVGRDDFDFFTPEFAQLGFDQERELMASGEAIVDVEQEEKHADGHTAWVSTTKMPLVTPSGETIGIFGLNRDITRRKLAELALRDAHDRLRAVVGIQREIAEAELDLQAVRSIVAARTRELAGADGAAILLLEEGELVRAAAAGRGVHAGPVRLRPEQDGLFRRTIESRRSTQLIESEGLVRAHPGLAPLFGANLHALLVVPLEHDGAVIGLLCVARKRATPFEQGLAESLELLSLVLSAALSNAAEFEQRRQRIEMLAQFQAIYSRAPIGIATVDSELRLHEPNPALCELLGRSLELLEGQPVTGFVAADDRRRARRQLRSLLQGSRDFSAGDVRFVHLQGQVTWAHLSVSLVRDLGGEPQFAILMIENVTERRLAEEAVREQAAINEYQALHDILTGLPNRSLFHDRIRHALLTAERERGRVAVLMLDLDRFKEVNDTLGHHAGDLLLQELASRLQRTLRATDTIARLGGDEFGLVLPGQIERSDVVMLLEKIERALEPAMTLAGLPLSIEGSIGVAMYPEDGTDVESLLRLADVAMYSAKEQGRNYAFYDDSLGSSSPARLMLVGELRQAIEQGQLVLHYQPKARLDGGSVCGVEALVRWAHPERGLVQPDEFIPTAQETGLIKPLTRFVLDRALEQIVAWRERGLTLTVSVNLAARNLIDASFPDEVASLLEKWQLEPGSLELEITESAVLDDPFRTRVVLERLHAMGIRLSIDDFGTGYSSLVYLKELPVSEIKIDRSFVLNMHRSGDDRVIVQSTIDLGRNLGLDVVAEGVETQTAWDHLRTMGCQIAQGYFFGRPMPADALFEWMTRGDAPAAEGDTTPASA